MTLGPQLDSPQGRPEIVNIGDLPKIEKTAFNFSSDSRLATNNQGYSVSCI